MKTRLLSTVAAALLASACVSAQSSQKLVVNVPFGFHVGNVSMPAGEYTVHNVSANIIRVASADFKNLAMTLTNRTEATTYNETPKLIFNRYGDKYFLSRICPSGTTGAAVPEGRMEKETALFAARHASETILARRSK